MSTIGKILALIALAVVLASGSAAAQQANSGSGTGPGSVQTFSLGDDTSYHIGAISNVDGWRAMEMGIRRVSVPAGSTAYVVYSAAPLPTISTGGGRDNAAVFGPSGFRGSAAIDPKSDMPKYAVTGPKDQYYMISQLSGGTKDYALIYFS